MLIRKMLLEDIKAVAEIEKQCFSQPWSEKSFEESIEREDTLFLLCELCGEEAPAHGCDDSKMIAGYIGMYLSFDEASITNVAVLAECRKHGIGEMLVTKAKETVKEADINAIFLEVRVSNAPAISLYKKMGFENLGVRKNFYDHPKEDAYIMRCDIA